MPMRLRATCSFTLVELLSTIAITAILVGALVVFVPQFVAWSRLTSDKQTLTVLNDALQRYKMQGGNVRALTGGTPIGRVITYLQTPVSWAGNTHQFLRSGVTYSGRSLQASGTAAGYSFVRFRSYTSIPGFNKLIITPSGRLKGDIGGSTLPQGKRDALLAAIQQDYPADYQDWVDYLDQYNELRAVPDGRVDGGDEGGFLFMINDPWGWLYFAGYMTLNQYLDTIYLGVGGSSTPELQAALSAVVLEIGDFGGDPTPSGIDPRVDGTDLVPDGYLNGADLYPFSLYLSDPELYFKINPQP